MSNVRPMRVLITAFILFCVYAPASFGADENLGSDRIGILPQEKCGADQRYWYPRVPPFVGFSKGEPTTAGGDGSCYIGFPRANSKMAIAMIDGKEVRLIPVRSEKRKVIEAYQSSDKSLLIEVMVTSRESTCSPDADSCCGDYTYSVITVTKAGESASVRAVKYEGG